MQQSTPKGEIQPSTKEGAIQTSTPEGAIQTSTPEGAIQKIDPTAWLAPNASLYGRIHIGPHASVWPHAVIRAESCEVRIGARSNIQDFVMLHVGYEHPTIIGELCSITHHATVHGAVIEDHCLIGINAVVMDGAVIGRGSIVAPGAVVPEGRVIPPHSIVAGIPAKVIKQRDSSVENQLNAWNYCRNAEAYARGEHRAWDGPDFKAFRAEKRRELEAGEG